METATAAPPPRSGLGATDRRDAWWLAPAATAAGLLAFGVYATWAAFQTGHYWVEGTRYLSPFFSPEVFGASPHAWFGPFPSWWPSWLPASPAFFILWAPGGFRLTCYYYRKAYYRAFFLDPAACAVGEARHGYCGETRFPFLLQNLHRYFLYFALVFLVFLWHDVVIAFQFPAAGGGYAFGIGVGSLVLLANTTLLTVFTLSCHALRHLVGGRLDCFGCEKAAAYRAWSGVSALNANHMLWAWVSLFMVGFADLYVRLTSMGVFRDPRIL